jgi:hypothetical protein
MMRRDSATLVGGVALSHVTDKRDALINRLAWITVAFCPGFQQ